MAVNNMSRKSNILLMNVLKNHVPKFRKHPVPQNSDIRTMDQIYSTFYKYSRKLVGAKYDPEVTLEARRPFQSELKVIIPLSTDSKERLKMAGADGYVRVGRILEAVDIVAPCCCYMLNREDLSTETFETGTLPRMFVTARFHKTSLNLGHNINPYRDIILKGKVTWTGETKAEATVSVVQNNIEFMTARLLFASLDGNDTSKKLPINQLKLINGMERYIHEKRQIINTIKPKRIDPESIQLESPEKGSITMASTVVTTEMTCQPEHENPYGSVFGGFLIRQGLETAELCAQRFSKPKPLTYTRALKVTSIDDAEFLKVIEIGSTLRFSAYVCNVSSNQEFQVCSQVEVYNESTHEFELCDRFLFTFETEEDCNLPQVFPQNMQECVAQWKTKNIGKTEE